MVFNWLARHWVKIVAVVAILALGAVLGARLAGCEYRSKPTADRVDTETQELLQEVHDLLTEIEKRQAERRRAAEGLR